MLMRKLALFSIFCLFILAFNSCQKDNFSPPEIQTLSIATISPNSISLVGNIITTGKQTIKDYGFVYSVSTQNPNETNGIKVSLGSNPKEGEFSKIIENINFNGAIYSNVIWARAYITDDKGTVFGSIISATLPSPNSSAIFPNSGQSGDVVKISGKFYHPNINAVVVNFQGVKAKVISATDTELSVEIPRGINAYHNQQISVTIAINGAMASNSTSFTLLANIKDFSPKTGSVGTLIILSGDNMPNNSYYSSNLPIYFGNFQANTGNYYSQVMVPFSVGETSDVSVMSNGQRKTLGVFTVAAPKITSVSPDAVLPTQTITISGSNFPTQYDASANRQMIKIGNGEYQNASYSSSSTFSYNVPSSTPEGEHTLYYRVGPHEVQAPKKLKVLGHQITGFSPSSGGPGKEVNIAGNFILNTSYYVAFGNINVYATATSATSLKVIVPTGIDVGKVKLTFDPSNKKILIPGEFDMLGPTFTSFTPTSGVAGTLITIKGSAFYQGSGQVIFGTVAVTPISVTENTMIVAVPSNVTPGAMKL
ncbi:MAG: hypothetical protein EOO92_14165 [Pedobacter sp.]|nr:MAG: hypothetical protein EOO92_14165 [Pedobacter sp.]